MGRMIVQNEMSWANGRGRTLDVALDFRGVPELDELVHFVRSCASNLEAETGARGPCRVRVQARWQNARKLYVVDVRTRSEERVAEVSESDADLFAAVQSAFLAARRALGGGLPLEESDPLLALDWHDGWQPVRRRRFPLGGGLNV